MQFFKDLNLAAFTGALPGTIGNGLAAAVRAESHREAAHITFLVTLSGVVAGAMALFVQQYGQARRPPLPRPAADSPTTSTP